MDFGLAVTAAVVSGHCLAENHLADGFVHTLAQHVIVCGPGSSRLDQLDNV